MQKGVQESVTYDDICNARNKNKHSRMRRTDMREEMKRTDKWMMKAAVIALLAGMFVAFLQGLNVYASPDQDVAAVDATYTDVQTAVIEDEAIPAAQFPQVSFPWWCYVIAIGAIAAGCTVYVYIQRAEKKSTARIS